MKQNKVLITAVFFAFLVFLASCTSKIPQTQAPPEEYISCSTDADCIPQPGCHPMDCINSQFKDRFEQPDACTEIYICDAAYDAADCLCRDNKCINRYSVESNPNC